MYLTKIAQNLNSIQFDTFIFERRILEGLKYLTDQSYTLSDALAIFQVRYQILRTEHPLRFEINDSEYWKGFYS